MSTRVEPWQLKRLASLAEEEPEVVQSALESLWKLRPDLLQKVTIAAVDEGEISAYRASADLTLSESEIQSQLRDYRKCALKRKCIVVADGSAKLAESGLPVREIVRVYRKLGSLARLQTAFASLSRQSLEAALQYADAHKAEIDREIADYDQAVACRRKSMLDG